MTDIVNEYFKQFYPPQDLIDDAEPSMASSYTGIGREVKGYSNVFPRMNFRDGFGMSVQGHHGAYSYPRDDWADAYEQVEIMAIQNAESLLDPYARYGNEVGNSMIYPYVPVKVVIEIIEKHGGLV